MSVGAVDVCFRGHIFERAIALIVIQDILRARQSARAAHHRNSLPYAGGKLAGSGSAGQIEVHVVGDDQIELSVTVVIDERTARAPCFSRARNSSPLRDLGEDPVIVDRKSTRLNS